MSYLKENERYIIETMLKDGKKVKDIATRLNRHISTIYNEIKRGTVTLTDTNLKPYDKYCADVGQRKQVENSHNKGITLKIGNDYNTVKIIETLVKEKRYSPYAVSVALKENDKYTDLCTTTIYSYIHNGLFLNISNNDLSYKITSKNKKETTKRPCYNKLGAKSIEEREKEISKREQFGHWEMDTVYSGKNKGKECLLVLTERKTRLEVIRKIADRTANSVLNEINRIEKEIGFNKFHSVFKTITCDNGVEFSKYNELEMSCTSIAKRTLLYFCHPFASCERGSNENANKLIRKFIPKGADISQYDNDFIQNMENIINDMPRKMFNGLSSNQYKASLGL